MHNRERVWNYRRKHHKYIWEFSKKRRRKSLMANAPDVWLNKPIEQITYRKLRLKPRTIDALNVARQGSSKCKTISGDKDNPLFKTKMSFSKSARDLFTSMGEIMIENSGGLYLEKFAYFSVELDPRLKEREDKGDVYRLKMYSDIKGVSPLKYMIMDRTFSASVRKRLSKSLYKGNKHYNYFNFIKKSNL